MKDIEGIELKIKKSYNNICKAIEEQNKDIVLSQKYYNISDKNLQETVSWYHKFSKMLNENKIDMTLEIAKKYENIIQLIQDIQLLQELYNKL